MTQFGVRPYSNGMSEAARRIHAAGVAFQELSSREGEGAPLPLPGRFPWPQVRSAQPVQMSSPVENNVDGLGDTGARSNTSPNVVSTSGPVFVGPLAKIIQRVAKEFDVTPKALTGQSRKRPLVYYRHAAMYACVCETDASLPEIGRRFGGRDHTTVINAVRTHARRQNVPLPRGMSPAQSRPAHRPRRGRRK